MSNNRLVTAYFDNRTDAGDALNKLTAAGVPARDIDLVAADTIATGSSGSRPAATSRASQGDDGFWASLSNLFMSDEDRYTYAEGIRRGGYVLTAHVSDAMHDRAITVLEGTAAVDIDERAGSWRSEGWTGYEGRPSAAPGSSYAASGAGSSGHAGSTAGRSAVPETTSRAAGATQGRGGTEQTIPVTEERLRVGKRVDEGRVRVRSYVEEKPVHKQVDLRQEHVDVERRPVNKPVSGADAGFQNRTLEATERSERAEVSKEARVVEEVALKKTAQTRTEDVSDTVRKTHVDVDRTSDRPGSAGKPGSRGS